MDDSHCEPIRTTRCFKLVVGFKVEDSQSPTSILTAREIGGVHHRPMSPRSKLAEALKTETSHPLPRLKLKSTPRPVALKKSLSLADFGSTERNDLNASPGSRASCSSTPMKIPPASMLRVQTCPIDLTDLHAATLLTTRAFSQNNTYRSDVSSCTIDEGDEPVVRDLFQSATISSTSTTPTAALASTLPSAYFPDLDEEISLILHEEEEAGQEEDGQEEDAVPNSAPMLQLRLPAAAHRRVRSVGTSAR